MIEILRSGYSRVPVFEGKHVQKVLGYLLVKSLVVVSVSVFHFCWVN